MAGARRFLGGGLDAILGIVSEISEEGESPSFIQQELKHIGLTQLIPGKYQPRREFDKDALHELSLSIKEKGILQPIIVRESKGMYEIIAGERRWRAAQLAGLNQVPVIVCELNDESALAFGLIENIQRKDLNPIEEAHALQRLMQEFDMTHEQIAKSIGRPRATVSNMLRLINLPKSIQALLAEKKLEVGHAKVLLPFSEEEQETYSNIILNKKLTVRETERLVKSNKTHSDKSRVQPFKMDGQILDFEKKLSEKFSNKVCVKINEAGVGTVIIHVESLKEIEWLVKN